VATAAPEKRKIMTPLAIMGLGVPELLIILAVVLLLFGGSRLAGLGKSTGRALKEFKEETKGLTKEEEKAAEDQQQPQVTQTHPAVTNDQPVDASGNAWPQQPSQGIAKDPSDVRRDL